jgi:hypothetical protein
MRQDLEAVTPAWPATVYRDENARLLVRAIYTHREALVAHHADVPVQGYSVGDRMKAEARPMTIQSLLALWAHAEELVGPCHYCYGGVARAMGCGGISEWYAFAPCDQCGHVLTRAFHRDLLSAILHRAGLKAGCPMPTILGWAQSSGLPHSALLTSLRAVGAKVLPPRHFSMRGAIPDQFCRVLNPVRQLAEHWATLGDVRIDAEMDDGTNCPTTTRRVILDFVEAYFHRNGRLPELDFAITPRMNVVFPMISQENIPALSTYPTKSDSVTD